MQTCFFVEIHHFGQFIKCVAFQICCVSKNSTRWVNISKVLKYSEEEKKHLKKNVLGEYAVYWQQQAKLHDVLLFLLSLKLCCNKHIHSGFLKCQLLFQSEKYTYAVSYIWHVNDTSVIFELVSAPRIRDSTEGSIIIWKS